MRSPPPYAVGNEMRPEKAKSATHNIVDRLDGLGESLQHHVQRLELVVEHVITGPEPQNPTAAATRDPDYSNMLDAILMRIEGLHALVERLGVVTNRMEQL